MELQESESLATELQQQGMRAACYHADVDASVREAVHSLWSAGISLCLKQSLTMISSCCTIDRSFPQQRCLCLSNLGLASGLGSCGMRKT